MRSPRKLLYERILDEDLGAARYVDMAARVRVFDRHLILRSPTAKEIVIGKAGEPITEYDRILADLDRGWSVVEDRAAPAELLPRVYGGRFDVLLEAYVGTPTVVHELQCHRGQLGLLDERDEYRHMLLGAQGSGKSMGAVLMASIALLRYPMRKGGCVAPVAHGLGILWDKLLGVLQPKGWVADARPAALGRVAEILCFNGGGAQFAATKKSSKAAVSPVAGKDWWWAVEDEQSGMDEDALREVDARGRVNAAYEVWSSATNEPHHGFQLRLKEWEAAADKRVFRLSGFENVFTPLSYWAQMRKARSASDWKRFVECAEVPQEGRVYPEFSYKESIQPVPRLARDVTAEITAQKYRRGYKYIVGIDFGRRVTASVVAKAYAGQANERLWYVVGEVVTEGKTTDWHLQELRKWFGSRGP